MSKSVENQIRKRIQESGEPSSLQQLCLDNICIDLITPNIKKMIESCINLEYLTMNDCSLQRLENFPTLRNLIVLELSDNQLSGDDLENLRRSPNINFLTIDSNQINRISNLRSLAGLEALEILQVHDNPLTNNYNYRAQIFSILPTIKAIDCQDRQGNKVKEQDPSQYFSYREPRSKIDLTDLLDDDDPNDNNNNLEYNSKTEPDYLEGRESQEDSTSNRQSIFGRNKGLRHFQPDLLNIRSRFDNSDSQQEGNSMIMDFRKKIQKKQ